MSDTPVETFEFFYSKEDVFSNFYPCTFKYQGIVFNCSEQFFMWCKAKYFKDHDTADEILLTRTPYAQKMLGKQVKGFNKGAWDKISGQVMDYALRLKFGQNAELKKILIDSYPHTLVEASPTDTKWGIGLGKDHPGKTDRRLWRGENRLGNCLMAVRNHFLIRLEIGEIPKVKPKKEHIDELYR